MMEVIVTNEFTHMNAGTERRPFKVLTPPERASAMVTVCQLPDLPRIAGPMT